MDISTKQLRRGDKTIRIPLSESYYGAFLSDSGLARLKLNEMFAIHPELFPNTFNEGYVLMPSQKQPINTTP